MVARRSHGLVMRRSRRSHVQALSLYLPYHPSTDNFSLGNRERPLTFLEVKTSPRNSTILWATLDRSTRDPSFLSFNCNQKVVMRAKWAGNSVVVAEQFLKPVTLGPNNADSRSKKITGPQPRTHPWRLPTASPNQNYPNCRHQLLWNTVSEGPVGNKESADVWARFYPCLVPFARFSDTLRLAKNTP